MFFIKRSTELICFLLIMATWTHAFAQETKAQPAKATPEQTAQTKARVEKLEATSRHAEQALSQGKAKRAQEHAQRAIKIWGLIEPSQLPDGETRDRACNAAASAMFTVAELERERLSQLKLSAKSLNEDIKRKIEAMRSAQAGYMKSLSLGQQCKQTQWVVASIVRTGELFEGLAREFEAAPLPPNLKGEEQVAVYRDALREFSSPMLQKARESYKTAQKLPPSGDVSTHDWHQLAQEGLDRLRDAASTPGKPKSQTP